MWTGTAASFVDLHPVGATSSEAYAIHGGQQVGDVLIGDVFHAGLWSGSSGSYVDLHPSGYVQSRVRASAGYKQAGGADVGGNWHAGTWTGTAESFVDLNPGGVSSSLLLATTGNYHAGIADGRAALWLENVDGYVDLGASLGAAFGTSEAEAIWTDGLTVLVGGYALTAATGDQRAILWTIAVPEPAAASLLVMSLVGLYMSRRWRKQSAM